MWNLWELKRWHSQRSGSTQNASAQTLAGKGFGSGASTDPTREPSSLDVDGENVRTHCGEYVPSRQDIQRECARIQAGWSDAERRVRGGARNRAAVRWQIPEVRASVPG